MQNKILYKDSFQDYLSKSPNKTHIHYWDLPGGFCVKLKKPIKGVPFRGMTNSITIGKLKRKFGLDGRIEREITSLITWRNKKHEINVNFPLSLFNKNHVQLYSLMLSEGSYKKGFVIQVPEEEFHKIFFNNLRKLFRNISIGNLISRGIKISFAPNKIRFLLPIPKYIPKFIFNNKDFAKIYLRIAFEAEGNARYKVLKSGGTSRRIKLSRNIGVDHLINEKLSYREGKRIYFGKLKKDYPNLAKIIIKNPCSIIIGERLMLKKHFNIDTSLYPEYLRINKTSFRRGKVSVKWTLTIHGININKFVEEIGFLTKNKQEIAKNMLNTKLQRPKYFALSIMRKVANKNIFNSNDYYKEMIKIGYKFPRVFLAKYRRKNLIKKIGPRSYKVLNYSL